MWCQYLYIGVQSNSYAHSSHSDEHDCHMNTSNLIRPTSEYCNCLATKHYIIH